MSPKKICIVVFSRANYGSIKSLIKEISKDKKFELCIVAGGSAMLNKFGRVSEIIKKDVLLLDGYLIVKRDIKI